MPRSLADIDWTAWRPVDRATLLFVIRGGRILLIRKLRGLGAGKINGPGGRLDPGETPLQAAVRETEEEIGIVPSNPIACGELRFQFTDGYALHGYVFRAARYTGSPRPSDEAIPLWTPLDAIPYPEMWADDVLWMPHLLEGRSFDGRFLFDGDVMLDSALEVGPELTPNAGASKVDYPSADRLETDQTARRRR